MVDELELRRTARAHRELAVAVANLASGVLILDPNLPEKPITFANPSFCAMIGYSAHEVIGRNCDLLQGPETDPDMAQAIVEAMEEKRAFKGIVINPTCHLCHACKQRKAKASRKQMSLSMNPLGVTALMCLEKRKALASTDDNSIAFASGGGEIVVVLLARLG